MLSSGKLLASGDVARLISKTGRVFRGLKDTLQGLAEGQHLQQVEPEVSACAGQMLIHTQPDEVLASHSKALPSAAQSNVAAVDCSTAASYLGAGAKDLLVTHQPCLLKKSPKVGRNVVAVEGLCKQRCL